MFTNELLYPYAVTPAMFLYFPSIRPKISKTNMANFQLIIIIILMKM